MPLAVVPELVLVAAEVVPDELTAVEVKEELEVVAVHDELEL